jgi:cell division protein FtsB
VTEPLALALLTAAVAAIGAVLTYLATRRQTDLAAINTARDSLARELREELTRLAHTTEAQEAEITKLRDQVQGLRTALEGYRMLSNSLINSLRVHDPTAADAALASIPPIPRP